MTFPNSAPASTSGFASYNKMDVKPNVNDQNIPSEYIQSTHFQGKASAPTTQRQNNGHVNALGLTGPYNFPIPQNALPLRVKIEAATPAPLSVPAQQFSQLVARNHQYANYARVHPYMHARMMRWPAMNAQSYAAPPPYFMTAPQMSTWSQHPRSLMQQTTPSSPVVIAPKPVRSWHIQAMQSLSAATESYEHVTAQSQSNAAPVKAVAQEKDILPAELDADNGIYRAYRADTGQRQILHNHAIEASLSDSDRVELAEMRGMVSKGLQPTACRLSGCDHVASCTRYLVKHVHSHLKIRWQCEFCERRFGARADMLADHVKREHPEMLAVFKIRRMHRQAPVVTKPVKTGGSKSEE